MYQEALNAETVLYISSQEDLMKICATKLDLHVKANPKKKQMPGGRNVPVMPAKMVAEVNSGGVRPEVGPPPGDTRTRGAKVVARVGSVTVKAGKS